jgi:hypothetical protein
VLAGRFAAPVTVISAPHIPTAKAALGRIVASGLKLTARADD